MVGHNIIIIKFPLPSFSLSIFRILLFYYWNFAFNPLEVRLYLPKFVYIYKYGKIWIYEIVKKTIRIKQIITTNIQWQGVFGGHSPPSDF